MDLTNSGCRACNQVSEYSSNDGAAYCSKCSSRDVPNAARTGCDPCPQSTDRLDWWDLTCVHYSEVRDCRWLSDQSGTCQDGYPNVVDGLSCTQCPLGQEFSGYYCYCRDCPAGQIGQQLSDGGRTCSNCGAGTYSAESGSLACSDCQAGQYQPSARATACLDCPSNQYSTLTKRTSCQNCADGTGSRPGSADCRDCEAGTVGVGTGRGCECCAPGSYSSAVGATGGQGACTACPAGHWTDGGCKTSASACRMAECGADFFCDGAKTRQQCTTCAEDEYQISDCTSSVDRQCGACTTCSNSQFYTAECTTTSDASCSDCSQSCPADHFRTAECSRTSDIQCSTCKQCSEGVEFMIQDCTATTDRVCQSCLSVCPNGQYLTGECTGSTDRYCTPCTKCAPGQRATVACSLAQDAVCEQCPAGR